MEIFEVLGPIMVGPSSSHTAGAVKIGYIARKLLGEEPIKAEIYLHGSFEATGIGHGTDRALVAGLLGMLPDDCRIPDSLELARELGVEVSFGVVNLKEVHPNTAVLKLIGVNHRKLDIVGSSVGGGAIKICEVDGLPADFTGSHPTLIVHNIDQPGHVAEVASTLSHKGINIATMQLYRNKRGGYAVMVIETDHNIPAESIRWLEHLDGFLKVTYLNLEDN